MKNLKNKLWLLLLPFLVFACNPFQAAISTECDPMNKECITTLVNLEDEEVPYQFKMRYEPQGRRILPFFRYPDQMLQFDHWGRNMSQFFEQNGVLLPGETITITSTLPDDFDAYPGYSLLEAYVHLDSPSGWTDDDAEYRDYAAIVVPGYVDRPITYNLSCEDGKAEVTITNNGEWGDRDVAVYLNEELYVYWQKYHVKAGETITVTTDPFPVGTYLMEIDVYNHQEQSYKDAPGFDYHGSRGYCIPDVPSLYWPATPSLPYNMDNNP